MVLTVELKPEVSTRLSEEAARHGVDAVEYACHLIESGLSWGDWEADTGNLSLARQTSLASEQTIRKLWDTPEEDEAWRGL